MTFKEGSPIYIQIAERISDEIIAGNYAENGRIPSVREYSVLLGVNVNTTVKAYEQLSSANIIYNRRGMGYFVAEGAARRIGEARRKAFLEEELPELCRRLKLLGITPDELRRKIGELGEKTNDLARNGRP